MPVTRLAPDALLEQTNLAGSLAAVQDDPAALTDTSWLTASSTANTAAHVSFPTPGGPLEGTQRFRAKVRKSTTNTGNPTVVLELWQAGSQVASSPSFTVTSAVGQVIEWTWTDPVPGADVECRVSSSSAGGNPSTRNSMDVGAVDWQASWSDAVQPELGSGGSGATVQVVTGGAGSAVEFASGGSGATVGVIAGGTGSWVEEADPTDSGSGGSGAVVEVLAGGTGSAVEFASGGSGAVVEVLAGGAGSAREFASGGSGATVQVVTGAGGSWTEGADPMDAGSGGSGAVVEVVTGGGGTAVEFASGGSGAVVGVATGGDGAALELASGGSGAVVRVLTGAGGTWVDVDLEGQVEWVPLPMSPGQANPKPQKHGSSAVLFGQAALAEADPMTSGASTVDSSGGGTATPTSGGIGV